MCRLENMQVVNRCLKGNNMYKIVFLIVGIFFIFFLWENCGRMILDMVIRCLFCLVCIYFFNELIVYFGGNISVKINEITACVSALFGVSGIAALYGLQLFFTMK